MEPERAAKGPPVRTVTVGGVGVVWAVPDAAEVRAGVEVVRPALAEARAEVAARAGAVLAAAAAAGVAAADTRTVEFRVETLRDYGDDPERGSDPAVPRGYEVTNEVLLVVRDLDRLGAVLDALVAAGANRVAGPEFVVSDRRPAETEARLLAMAEARAAAETLAGAAGMALGRVVSIVEPEGRPGGGPVGRAMMAAEAATPTAAGRLEVRRAVRVTWALVPA